VIIPQGLIALKAHMDAEKYDAEFMKFST